MRAVVIDSEVLDPRHSEDSFYKTKTANRHLQHPKVLLADLPEPHLGPTDILINIRACGLCGSDIAMTSTDTDGFVQYPFMMSSFIVPGHEFAGQVALYGKDVRTYWPDIQVGDCVTAQCVLNCGYCNACKVGLFDSCEHGDEIGFTKNGGLAQFCVVDMRHVWNLAPLLRTFDTVANVFLAGSLVEPHAGVFKAITESNFAPGDSVLVLGLGPIGLAAVNIFQALGAGSIIGCDPSSRRRTLAKDIGASCVYDPTAIPMQIAVELETRNQGVSVIFEASGVAEKNWEGITEIIAMGKPNIQLIFFGQSKKDLVINPQPFIQKYVRFSGSHGHTKVWDRLIKLFAAKRINPLKMITQTISLEIIPVLLPLGLFGTNEGKITAIL